VERLHRATQETLSLWMSRLREEVGESFPEKVTAFREGMAVSSALPGLRLAGPAHRLRLERDQLLRHVSDRRQVAGRSGPVETPARGLAQDARGAGAASRTVIGSGVTPKDPAGRVGGRDPRLRPFESMVPARRKPRPRTLHDVDGDPSPTKRPPGASAALPS
jgi:hypothetical protein